MTLTTDELWPRTAEFRFRLYARVGDELTVLATAPDAGGLGQAIVALHEDAKRAGRRLCAEGRVGVMDVLGGKNGRGEWIIPVFDRSGLR